MIIGRRGAGVEQLKAELAEAHRQRAVHRRPGGAQGRDQRAARRREHRDPARAPRRLPPRDEEGAVSIAMKFGAKGIRVDASGRLGGAEIARDETYREGRVPLHTLRADIEFGTADAQAPPTAPSASRSGSSRAKCFRSAAAVSPSSCRRRALIALNQEICVMLQPKRTKYRKQQKGKRRGLA